MKKLLFLLLLLPTLAFSQLELPYSVKILSEKPLDFWYGPYASVAAANAAVPVSIRPNKTVKVGSLEYWWKDGTADGDLVVKLAATGWALTGESFVTDPTITGNTRFKGNMVLGTNQGAPFPPFPITLDVRGATVDGTGYIARFTDGLNNAFKFLMSDRGSTIFTADNFGTSQYIYTFEGGGNPSTGTNEYTLMKLQTRVSASGGTNTYRGLHILKAGSETGGTNSYTAIETESGDIKFKGISENVALTKTLVYDNTTGQLYWKEGSGGGYTFGEGLVESGGAVKLGGVMADLTNLSLPETTSLFWLTDNGMSAADKTGIALGSNAITLFDNVAGAAVSRMAINASSGITIESKKDIKINDVQEDNTAAKVLVLDASNNLHYTNKSSFGDSYWKTGGITTLSTVESTEINLGNDTNQSLNILAGDNDIVSRLAIFNGTDSPTISLQSNKSSEEAGRIRVDNGSVNMEAFTVGSDQFSLEFSGVSNTAIFRDARAIPKGIEYVEDYSATYTDRSLVDKAYVTKTANSGTYTPTATVWTNVDAVTTPYPFFYTRTGNVVNVSGMFNVDVATTGASASVKLSLPVPANFVNLSQLVGTGHTATPQENMAATADYLNDTALISFTTATAGVQTVTIQFMYLIP